MTVIESVNNQKIIEIQKLQNKKSLIELLMEFHELQWYKNLQFHARFY